MTRWPAVLVAVSVLALPAPARPAEAVRPNLRLALELPEAAAAGPAVTDAVPDLHPAPPALAPPLVASKGAPEPSGRERAGRTLQVVGLSTAGIAAGAGVAAGLARDSGSGWLSSRNARLTVGWTLVGGLATFVVGSVMRTSSQTDTAVPSPSLAAGAPPAAPARPDLSAPAPHRQAPGADGFTATEQEIMARAEAGRQRRSSGNLAAGLGVAATLVGLALTPFCAAPPDDHGFRTACGVGTVGLLGGATAMITGLIVAGQGDSQRRIAESDWSATHGGGRLQLE